MYDFQHFIQKLHFSHAQISTLNSQLAGLTVSTPTTQRDVLAVKASTSALLESLNSCVEIMAKREEVSCVTINVP